MSIGDLALTEDKTVHIKDDEGLTEPIVPTKENFYNTSVTTIQSSPYIKKEHALQLENLDLHYRILASALRSLRPLTTDRYAFDDYDQVFNFEEIRTLIQRHAQEIPNYTFPATKAYVIAFRSRLTEDAKHSAEKRQALADIDKASHIEANQSGGLLKYWFGVPEDTEARNLATCYWTDKASAKKGGGGKAHRVGMTTAKAWFALWEILEFELQISENADTFKLVLTDKR